MGLENGNRGVAPGTKIESDTEIRRRIIAEMMDLGVFECPSGVIDRLFVLEKNSDFNKDSRMVQEGFKNVLLAIERKDSTLKFTPEQKRDGALAAFIHDIGKSSSSEDPACQLAVVKLFSTNSVQGPNQTVLETIKISFPDEVNTMISNLSKINITSEITMRAFWDMHAFWTREILAKFSSVFSERVILIAASHHIDQGNNPYGINSNEIPNECKILLAIDKYQARIARNGATHKETVEYLRDVLKKYHDDPVMILIIEAIDKLGRVGNLFSETQKELIIRRE